ncbi:MAG: CotH kinase family protein [Firmicutes bacterium]|nr:CotH kinase family protein [Bacillota bacterium]
MKITIKSFLYVVVIFSLQGCNLLTQSTNTTISSSIETTLDERYVLLQNEYTYLESFLPNVIIENFLLPSPQNQEIETIYYLDDYLITDSTVTYTKYALDTETILSIELSINDYSLTKSYSITMLRDPLLYEQYQIDSSFSEIINLLKIALPDEINSDFTLPIIQYDDAIISYTTSESRIFNNRYIFPFPVNNTDLIITARIQYLNETKTSDFIVEMKGLNSLPQIPIIYITTENNNPITSKEDYIDGVFSMVTYDEDKNETVLLMNQNIQIRGRGNSTFYMPKLSFRIKFENKTSLLFDYEESDWVLLANFTDQTLIRNYLANSLSNSMNMEFTPSSAFADVYLNNEYIGNYMISDQIEVSNDRVNIEEHSSELDTGYLVEMDKRLLEFPEGVEGIDYFILFGIPYAIKSPKTDSINYSTNQLYFIEDYIMQVHLTLQNHQDYSNLIDESSFIDWFIIEELFKNVDSGYSSVYMYKDTGEKLKMGPIWDFDLSTSNPGHLEDALRVPEGWYTSLSFKNIWYYYLMQYDEFQLHLKERWNELYSNQIQELIASVYPVSDLMSKSRYLNFQRWNIIGVNEDWYTSTEVLAASTYEEQVKILYDYLYIRSIWLNEEINKF